MSNWFYDYQNAFNEAKQANESRYGTILGGYDSRLTDFSRATSGLQTQYNDRFDRIMGRIYGVGQSQRNNLDESFDRNRAGGYASAISRGLGNTTVLDATTRGIDLDRERAKIQLEDALSREQSDYDARLSGESLAFGERGLGEWARQKKEKLDFMERRTDAYPDPNVYAAAARDGLSTRPGGGGGGFSVDRGAPSRSQFEYPRFSFIGSDVAGQSAYNQAMIAYAGRSKPPSGPITSGGYGPQVYNGSQMTPGAPQQSMPYTPDYDYGGGYGIQPGAEWSSSGLGPIGNNYMNYGMSQGEYGPDGSYSPYGPQWSQGYDYGGGSFGGGQTQNYQLSAYGGGYSGGD